MFFKIISRRALNCRARQPIGNGVIILNICHNAYLGNYVKRQTITWTKQYEASKTHEIKEMDNLVSWLRQHVPSSDKTTVVHGDFRLSLHEICSFHFILFSLFGFVNVSHLLSSIFYFLKHFFLE